MVFGRLGKLPHSRLRADKENSGGSVKHGRAGAGQRLATMSKVGTVALKGPDSPPARRKAQRTEIARTVSNDTIGAIESGYERIQIEVEFKLFSESARSVSVAGSFNGWGVGENPLGKEAECWRTVIKLPRGHYEYRFVVDGQWVSDPSAKESMANPFGGSNSVLSL